MTIRAEIHKNWGNGQKQLVQSMQHKGLGVKTV